MNATIATSADHDKAFEIINDVQLVDLTYRDAQFVRAELADKIAESIAAAVQAEREACAKRASKAIMSIKTGTDEARDWTLADLRGICANAAQDAIRARSETK